MDKEEILLRQFALDRALNATAKKAYHLNPQDIVDVAEVFYTFLRGENK